MKELEAAAKAFIDAAVRYVAALDVCPHEAEEIATQFAKIEKMMDALSTLEKKRSA
jgi:Asp-tRNA(Asn)/Glu-tRNA(Gln) amidotransferase C subunit